MSPESFTVDSSNAGKTIAATLRLRFPDLSWSQVRRLITTRRVRIGEDLCFDPARRLKEGDVVELLATPAARFNDLGCVVVMRHLDEHVVVVEKPSGINTVRHPSERGWTARRKALSPTLEDFVPKLIARQAGRVRKGPLPRLRVVHRIDKETSGLVVFARTAIAERELGKQFRRHTVVRRYLAIVISSLESRTIRSRLVRDRGDGRRGSTDVRTLGKEAVTHVDVVERLAGYTLVSCRLETGRTHQIRIHLAESGHPVCGEKVYNRPLTMPSFSRDAERRAAPPTRSAAASRLNVRRVEAPRLALHATELGFVHPTTKETMHWTMPLPPDLAEFLEKLRRHER